MADSFIEVFSEGRRLMEVPLKMDPILVGRDAACTIRLDDHAISRNHAEVRRVGDAIEVLLSSRFGRMMVNGAETQRARIVLGDRVEIGPFVLVLQQKQIESPQPVIDVMSTPQVTPVTEEAAPEEPLPQDEVAMPSYDPSTEQQTASIPIAALEEPVFSIPNASQVVISEAPQEIFLETENSDQTRAFEAPMAVAELIFSPGSANSERYEILDNEISLGRAPNCHVVLEDAKSSRKHAIIKRRGQGFVLQDLGSANGTSINGSRVSEAVLSSGDQIQIGNTTFQFRVHSKDYEEKERNFLPVEIPAEAVQVSEAQPYPMAGAEAQPSNAFVSSNPGLGIPSVEKKSAIGRFLEYYRTLPPKMQIIYGAAILGVFYMVFFDEDPAQKQVQPSAQQVSAKKPVKDSSEKVGLPHFEALSPEQKRYVEAQYQLSVDYYKNRDYAKAIFEVDKIFQVTTDFKQAREIRSYAQEAQAKIEQEEKNRKRKDLEKAQRIKLDTLTQQAGALMAQKKYTEAEGIFAEIEIIEPENALVNAWRNEVIAERERKLRAKEEAEKLAIIRRQLKTELTAILARRSETKDYYAAIDELSEMKGKDPGPSDWDAKIDREIEASTQLIANERDPLLRAGKEAEDRGDLAAAYNSFSSASKVDPEDKISKDGMKRIKGMLEAKSKHIYIEAVFAESLGDVETAKAKFKQILDSSTRDDSYHEKAQAKLRRLTILDAAASPTPTETGNP